MHNEKVVERLIGIKHLYYLYLIEKSTTSNEPISSQMLV